MSATTKRLTRDQTRQAVVDLVVERLARAVADRVATACRSMVVAGDGAYLVSHVVDDLVERVPRKELHNHVTGLVDLLGDGLTMRLRTKPVAGSGDVDRRAFIDARVDELRALRLATDDEEDDEP